MSRVTAIRAYLCERCAVPGRFRTGALCAALAASCLLVWACSLPDDTPTEPEPVQSAAPVPTADPNNPAPAPIMGAPAPKPTPTPDPSAEPSPDATPNPATPGEGAAECGSPTPPPLSRFNVKVHLKLASAWVLDSTPLVGPDAAYCASIGFPDRSICPVRPEGNPQRQACELYIVGRALDTGRPGPTWYRGSSLCTGASSGCDNHPDNQYLLLVHTSGNYRACGRNGVCGDVDVDK